MFILGIKVPLDQFCLCLQVYNTTLGTDSFGVNQGEENPSHVEVVVPSASFCPLFHVSFHSFVDVNLLMIYCQLY